MHRVFIGLGSNVGDRLQFLRQAVAELMRTPGVTLTSMSSVYETEPVGVKNQSEFLNAAVEVSCSMTPAELYERLKEIERSIGRTPTERWGPREIDLDLLYFNGSIVHNARFIIPHRESSNRRFVLVPMSEIAGEFVDPVQRKTMNELLALCPDHSEVKRSVWSLHQSTVEG